MSWERVGCSERDFADDDVEDADNDNDDDDDDDDDDDRHHDDDDDTRLRDGTREGEAGTCSGRAFPEHAG